MSAARGFKPVEIARFVSQLPEDAEIVLVARAAGKDMVYWSDAVEKPTTYEGPRWARCVLQGVSDALGMGIFPPEAPVGLEPS